MWLIAVRIVEASEQDRRPPTVVDVRFHEFDVYIGRRSPRARDRRCHRRSVWANPYGMYRPCGWIDQGKEQDE